MARNAVYPARPSPPSLLLRTKDYSFSFFFLLKFRSPSKINKSDSGGEGGREFRYSMYGYKFGGGRGLEESPFISSQN